MTVRELNGLLTRTRLRLGDFDLEFKCKKGAGKHHADALSQLVTTAPTTDHDDNDVISTFLLEEYKFGKNGSSYNLSKPSKNLRKLHTNQSMMSFPWKT